MMFLKLQREGQTSKGYGGNLVSDCSGLVVNRVNQKRKKIVSENRGGRDPLDDTVL